MRVFANDDLFGFRVGYMSLFTPGPWSIKQSGWNSRHHCRFIRSRDPRREGLDHRCRNQCHPGGDSRQPWWLLFHLSARIHLQNAFNAFVGTLNNGNPQELDNLKAEWSVSANDATNRLVGAIIWQIPVGRGYLIGTQMNRVLDGVVGGWQLTTLTTFQTGQPMAIFMSNARLADGNQRPNVVCPQSTSLTTGISAHSAARYGSPYLNANCFADPGDQQPGNAPRYFSNLRANGIHEADVTLEKQFQFGDKGHMRSMLTASIAPIPLASARRTLATETLPLALSRPVLGAPCHAICSSAHDTSSNLLHSPISPA